MQKFSKSTIGLVAFFISCVSVFFWFFLLSKLLPDPGLSGLGLLNILPGLILVGTVAYFQGFVQPIKKNFWLVSVGVFIGCGVVIYFTGW